MTKRFLFERVIQEGIELNFTPGQTQESREWFREQAQKLKDIRPERVVRRPGAIQNSVSFLWRPGEMYLFRYEPKNRDTLPYYDRYPLIMLLDTYRSGQDDGFLGINFHYLPPILRAALMEKMYRFKNNNHFDETTRLLIKYPKLDILPGRPLWKACIKRYLNSHVRGRFIKIHPAEWDLVLMMPLDRFMKKRRSTVWIDSKRIYQGTN